ncbi:DivIVA domain-containing protein [Melghirimyces thermohalophilus]|uniref:DivIVA domain-containing protein n=1 Tax=Melghirimyces thermohalophilus TaxID=1236220 RepID=UPI000B87E8C5
MELHNQEFHRAFRGYNRKEVDAYMRKVIESYEILVRKEEWTLEQGVPVIPGGKQLLTPRHPQPRVQANALGL